MRSRALLASAVLMAAASAPAHAAVVTYQFTGALTFPVFGFAAPQTITGSFTYDSDAPYESGGVGNVDAFYGSPLAISFNSSDGGASFSATDTNAGRTLVHDDTTNFSFGPGDSVQFITSEQVSGNVNGDPVRDEFVAFYDPSGMALSSDQIPSSFSNSTYLVRNFGFDVYGSKDIFGNPQIYQANYSITLSAVPEPATWAMMIGGIGVAGGVMRRRRNGVRATVSFA